MIRLAGIIAILSSACALSLPQPPQDTSKHISRGILQHDLVADDEQEPTSEEDGIHHLCHHCGHYCGGQCSGGGNNLNLALLPENAHAVPSTTNFLTHGPNAQEEDDSATTALLVTNTLSDDVESAKAENKAEQADVKKRMADKTTQAVQTRDAAALNDQAYSIESRLEDLATDDSDDLMKIEANDEEDAKEAEEYGIESSLEDLENEEALEEESVPPIANELSESLEVLQEAQNSLDENLEPIISPDAPRKQEVFCDEVSAEADKAAKLKSRIKKESDDLKLEETQHKLESDSSAAEEAMSKERNRIAEE